MSQPSAYSQHTVNSPNRLKAWSHKTRYAKSVEFIRLNPHDTLLDFGTGDAWLLVALAQKYPHAVMTGYDNADYMIERAVANTNAYPRIAIYQSLYELQERRFDVITCLETFEHITGKGLNEASGWIVNHLKPDGRFIVSVPIEVGPPALVKNLIRLSLGQRPQNLTPITLLKATLGIRQTIHRRGEDNGFTGQHFGFDHRRLTTLIESHGVQQVRRLYSPLSWLGGAANSQVFMEFRLPST